MCNNSEGAMKIYPLICVLAGALCLLPSGCGAVAEPPQPEVSPPAPPEPPPLKAERLWRRVDLIGYDGVVLATGADWVTLAPGWQGGRTTRNPQQPDNSRPKR